MGHEAEQVTVVLSASGTEPSRVPGRLVLLGPGARARRAATVVLIAMVMSAMLIPIPIVHLIGIPLTLFIGIAVAVRTSRAVARLEPTHLPCPKCGARNNVGGGLGYRSATGPIDRACESCRRPLELRFER